MAMVKRERGRQPTMWVSTTDLPTAVSHDVGFRTYISEPDRPPQGWIDQHAERDAVYANRRRIQGGRGKGLLRRRGELLERPTHTYMRPGACDGCTCVVTTTSSSDCWCMRELAVLGSRMRTVCGIGTPRGLQGRVAAMIAVPLTIWNQRFAGIAAVLRRHADHILELASTRRRSAIGTHG